MITFPSEFISTFISKTSWKEEKIHFVANTSATDLADGFVLDGEAIYKIFGAIKHAFPKLRTVATLPDGRKFGRTDWTRLPADLPVDVWVDLYAQDYDAEKLAAVRAWTAGRNAAGQPHEYVWYWAIGPHKEPWPNTFVERAAIEARLLFWLSSLHGVRGMVNINSTET